MKGSVFKKIVGLWLLLGAFMVFVQVVIGGITRLTGSGLSITKWEIVTGTLPPLNAVQWNEAFELYKETPQYQKINEGMDMTEFRFIYFWEYLHRLWARTMGFVFIIPFFIFLIKGWINYQLLKRLGLVILISAIVASFGWIMVASGLVDRPWVNAYKLMGHLTLAFLLFGVLWWTILHYWDGFRKDDKYFSFLEKGDFGKENLEFGGKVKIQKLIIHNTLFIRWGWINLSLLSLQIVIGGLMSGMKAALYYPSFPKMGDEWFPSVLLIGENWVMENFINYDIYLFMPALVQVFHRVLALVLIISVLAFVFKISKFTLYPLFSKVLLVFAAMISLQVILGILTLIHSIGKIPVGLGVYHQAGALLLFASALYVQYLLLHSKAGNSVDNHVDNFDD